MKVLCIGKCNYDITIEVDELPSFGNKYKFIEANRCGGGSAGNVAYLLGKWGVDTVVSALLGADTYAEANKKDFGEANVNTNYLETNFEHPTAISLVMINKIDRSRIIYDIGSEYKPLKKYNYDFTPEFIFSDGYDYGATQNAVNKYSHVPNVLDAREVTKETLELSKYMKTIIASLDFATNVTKTSIDYKSPQTLVNMYSKLMNKYPNSEIIVTLGSHGALYKCDNQIKIMPGLNMDIKDITGSKDAFIATYIYSLVNNFDVEKSITLANIAAGLVAAEIGGRSSMPALSTVLDEYNKKKGGSEATSADEEKKEDAKTEEVKEEKQADTIDSNTKETSKEEAESTDTKEKADEKQDTSEEKNTSEPVSIEVAVEEPKSENTNSEGEKKSADSETKA